MSSFLATPRRRCAPALIAALSAWLLLLPGCISAAAQGVPSRKAGEPDNMSYLYKWVSPTEVAFSSDGSFTREGDFTVSTRRFVRRTGISYPARYTSFPVEPEGAVNLTYSPDSTMLAFTRANDLYVLDIASRKEVRLTDDGSDVVLNGYASWVYYEEIFGRPSRYKAFWWSPDSRRLAFYRFDNSGVPMFPIYSPKGQDGKLSETRYPKAGEPNPEVRIGFVEVAPALAGGAAGIVWADFDEKEDQYFGTPFWGAQGDRLYVSREPRTQNTLDVYSVDPATGSKRHVYNETYKTWLDWIDGMLFSPDGIYMARSFESGWQQIYFLSYDGQLRRLTSGTNWRVALVRHDQKTGDVYFTAYRDTPLRQGLYKVDKAGAVTALSDPAYSVHGISFSPDGKWFVMTLSNFTTPVQTWLVETAHAGRFATSLQEMSGKAASKYCHKVYDQAGDGYDPAAFHLPQHVSITTPDSLVLPGFIVYPKDFDPSKKYPVHVDLYGGPDSPRVLDSWKGAHRYDWYAENGIIEATLDCRAAGHSGRRGLDDIFQRLDEKEVGDFVLWARYLQSLPYVQADKIGVEGFSFGGTMTSLLVMDHSDCFHYGIAGGGVYDWALYDSHYTERFMRTPADNKDGYAATRVVSHVVNYPVTYKDSKPGETDPVMLKITHGTGDDNVHFQNTLQLVDELIRQGKKFELMIYPDGMHGYRGAQGAHFLSANREFWLKYLKPGCKDETAR